MNAASQRACPTRFVSMYGTEKRSSILKRREKKLRKEKPLKGEEAEKTVADQHACDFQS